MPDQGEIIRRHVRDYRVERWLAGSTERDDRPTLAELEEGGYRVVRVEESDDVLERLLADGYRVERTVAKGDPDSVWFIERCYRMLRDLEAASRLAIDPARLSWRLDHDRYRDLLYHADEVVGALEVRLDPLTPLWIFGIPVLARPTTADEIELVYTDRPRP